MGWTTCFHATEWKNQGNKRVVDRRKECDKMLNWTSTDKNGNVVAVYKVLKSAMVGSTYYAAVEKKTPDGNRNVWAAVFLTCGRSSDGTIWGYKDMGEDECPYRYDCPVGILDLLTPTDSEYALEWRKQCRQRIKEKAEAKKNPSELYAPSGIRISVKGRSWVIANPFCRFRFAKARYHNPDYAMMVFLKHYGTAEQKREFALSGRNCPEDWKEVAA